jgi:2-polyprenyl-3-methyl-5-hydroxy-6-metoxy-1,4-benzoquinol methylase
MWDHNIHYHEFLIRHIPEGAQRALDVGCGAGLFPMRLAEQVPEVIAIDRDADTIQQAREMSPGANVHFVEADVLASDFTPGSFDFVSCLSALHHMPLEPAIERLASLLAPGGTLAILGLYKLATPLDLVYVGATGLLDLAVGVVRHRTQAPLRRPQGVVLDWDDSLGQIRATANRLLPGSIIKRHMYDRYSLLYSRPD